MILPTVKIAADNARGFKIINEADFNPEVHVLFGADPEPAEFTRESVATMPKGDVRELLDAHGVEVAKGATVGEMREALARVMFLDA